MTLPIRSTNPRPTISSSRKRGIAPFPYFGGKFIHLKWLLPLLPECHAFVDVFGGSGAVILNRNPSPVDVYNDLDGRIVHFFKILREHTDELISALQLTPYSRSDFELSLKDDEGIDDVERARRTFVKFQSSRGGRQGDDTHDSGWSWSKTLSRGGISGCVNAFRGRIRYHLRDVAKRLLSIQIENRPFQYILERYDSPDTLFYLDPPYMPGSGLGSWEMVVGPDVYRFPMSESDHAGMLSMIVDIQGRAAISSYRNDLYEYVLSDWTSYDQRVHTSGLVDGIGVHSAKIETLWTNYEL